MLANDQALFHGELNPIGKGSVGDRGAEGSDRKIMVRSESEPDTAGCIPASIR